jgi:hypothetical protein
MNVNQVCFNLEQVDLCSERLGTIKFGWIESWTTVTLLCKRLPFAHFLCSNSVKMKAVRLARANASATKFKTNQIATGRT